MSTAGLPVEPVHVYPKAMSGAPGAKAFVPVAFFDVQQGYEALLHFWGTYTSTANFAPVIPGLLWKVQTAPTPRDATATLQPDDVKVTPNGPDIALSVVLSLNTPGRPHVENLSVGEGKRVIFGATWDPASTGIQLNGISGYITGFVWRAGTLNRQELLQLLKK